VLFWFVGGAFAIVWFVFRDPRFDWRMLAIGALLPDLIDGAIYLSFGGPLVAHSVVTVIAMLILVMLATIGRRSVRKKALAVAIGMFLHLVLDGVWNNAEVFWWPLSGLDQAAQNIPTFVRPLGISVALEVVGIALCVWFARRFNLRDTDRRALLLHKGEVRVD
jgi:hypothetical protein